MFYLIDKPYGMSSFDVIRFLKKKIHPHKIGYLGTLDPFATGCLLIATDNSTKLLSLLNNIEKSYIADIRIDGYTESLDRGTECTPVDISHIFSRSQEGLREFLLSQTVQVPPKFSAIHINGTRAYKLARENLHFDIKERPIKISFVDIIKFDPPFFRIAIRISSGGYIRSLAPVIASYFGIENGGYLTDLSRITLHVPGAELSLALSQSLTDFDGTKALSYKLVFPMIDTIEINDREYSEILLGKSIPALGDYINGQLLFLNYRDVYQSLVSYEDGLFVIKRNNV